MPHSVTRRDSIQAEAEPYGICKIVPPEGWHKAQCQVDLNSPKTFPTKRQRIDTLQVDGGRVVRRQSSRAQSVWRTGGAEQILR